MTPSLLDMRFIAALVALMLLRMVVPTRYQIAIGALGTVVILGIASPRTLVVLATVGGLFVYPLHLVSVGSGPLNGVRVRKLAMIAGVSGVVALLVWYKIHLAYALPFIGDPLFVGSAGMLFGFSYFAFRAINFLVIQYLTQRKERSLLVVLYYFLFPSTLTSGPIQKFADFRTQSVQLPRLTRTVAGRAIHRITRGFFYKICVAFVLDGIVSANLAVAQMSAWHAIVITGCLYLYFYFDFAGYSDIAIGLGLLLGFVIPENFNRPFLATSLTEFWRHWHITLVDWLRDHVFIPLGGMRAHRMKAGALAALIMVLCGLWHGLTLPFLIWGIWHGAHLFLESISGMRPIPRGAPRGVKYWSLVAWTNARVAIGALLFLPNSADTLRVLRAFL